MKNSGYYRSPIGVIEICSEEDVITSLQFCDDVQESDQEVKDESIRHCIKELQEYFNGKRINFTSKLQLEGTDFQKQIYHGLINIPFGKSISYSELANQIGRPDAVRAVGNVNSKNSILLLLPCHRVVGRNGDLVGYAGGLWRKKWLLEHESKFSGRGEQVAIVF
jgi:methylated-DNA-[protein]-cysteine S-methyltransferase